MKKSALFFLTILSFIIGIALYAYHKEWVIIVHPYTTTSYNPTESVEQDVQHRKVGIYFFKHQQWHKEEINIIWSSDIAQNIKTVTNNWLMLLEDEKIIDKDIQVLSSVVTTNKELFLSFNKDPFNKQDATYIKLMIIQGLLKTIHENKIAIQSVRFLVHHQTLMDDHLNFSIPWPIAGFM